MVLSSIKFVDRQTIMPWNCEMFGQATCKKIIPFSARMFKVLYAASSPSLWNGMQQQLVPLARYPGLLIGNERSRRKGVQRKKPRHCFETWEFDEWAAAPILRLCRVWSDLVGKKGRKELEYLKTQVVLFTYVFRPKDRMIMIILRSYQAIF